MGSGKADQHHRVKLMVSSKAAQYYKTYLFGIHFQQVGRISVIKSVSKLPLRWSWVHACLSVESKSNHLNLVVNGRNLIDKVFTAAAENLSKPNNLSGKLLLGKELGPFR